MSIWQTKSWQEMLKNSNQIQNFFEFDWVFVEKRSIWLGQFWLFILWIKEEVLNEDFFNKLKKLCKDENCLFFQLETISYEDKRISIILDFKVWYYKKFITPYTAIIDLNLSEDDILSMMKPKWRYNIRLAEKKWVVVYEVEKTRENVEIFYNLMLETTSRDNFNWNSLDYYLSFLNGIKESKLFIAYYQDVAVSAGIFTYVWNVAIYYYW